MRISYSALGTFRQCPQKYKFQEIDKIPSKKSKEALFGTLIHASLKRMFSHDPLFPTLDEVIAEFRMAWNVSRAHVELSEEESYAYLGQGEHILRRFYAKNKPWNFNVVDLESRFEVIIQDSKTGEAHVLAGIIDRIDKPTEDMYEIIDYKTARKMKSQESVDTDLQLSLYHLGLVRRWPHIEKATVVLSLYYVKHNEKITTTRSPTALEAVYKNILVTIHDIKDRTSSGEFPPQPSALCDWCGYKAMCPAWKFLYSAKQTVLSNKLDIEKIIIEYFEIKKTAQKQTKRLAELQADIKAYMDQEGLTRVFGDGGSISKTVQERYRYDYEKIKAVLADHNRMDVWEAIMSPDDKKLKTALGSLPSPLKEKVLEARSVLRQFETLTTTIKKASDSEPEARTT